jgi:hypothetical protein
VDNGVLEIEYFPDTKIEYSTDTKIEYSTDTKEEEEKQE